MAGKKFKFRTDGNRRVAIKEVVTRSVSVRGPRISVSMGLDSELNLSNKYIVDGNIFTMIESTKGLKKGKGSKVIYYTLDEISYIATLTLQFNKSKKIVEKTLTLYVPQGVCSSDEIYCNRFTSSLSSEEKELVIENILGYATSRI